MSELSIKMTLACSGCDDEFTSFVKECKFVERKDLSATLSFVLENLRYKLRRNRSDDPANSDVFKSNDNKD